MTLDAQAPVTGNLLFNSTGYIGLPSGSTVQRPVSASAGYFRFNNTTVTPEYYDGTAWDSIAPTISQPQGYLTLTSGTPVITADVTAATAVYYTPYVGQVCPVYNGTAFVNQIFTEQTLTLVSQHIASAIYDVFAFVNSGTFTIATGPAWSSSSAGSSSRGTGAGTTQLQRISGIYTNQQSMTARNGSVTYTIAANLGTYLGSILIDGSAGQISCYRSFGQSRKWGVWNTFNRVPIILKAGDGTASWGYTSATFRPSNNSTANSISVFTGLAEEEFDLNFSQTGQIADPGGTTITMQNAIGWNSTTAGSGKFGLLAVSTGSASVNVFGELKGVFHQVPSLGLNTVTALESGNTGGGSTFVGTNQSMELSASYRG